MSRDTLALLLTACLASGPAFAADAAKREHGQRLFFGAEPLRGRITGHTADLPTQASRCANCHLTETSRRPAGPSASQPATLGPDLTVESLSQLRRRRGGPPSTYDERGLCKVLRTGIDPVYILMPTTMPRYDASDQDCEALWAYLNWSAR